MRKILFLMACLLTLSRSFLFAQEFTRQDTLRGSNGRGRSWWDVKHYDLKVTFDTATRSISGSNTIEFKITGTPGDSMQIDLQEPMMIDSVVIFKMTPTNTACEHLIPRFVKDGNVWWITNCNCLRIGGSTRLIIYYHGKPREAVNPPWDGGFSWKTDSLGNPWIAVSCQGLGASVWWPCKDYQGDEPDSGINVSLEMITGKIPFDHLTGKTLLVPIGNGRLTKGKFGTIDTIYVTSAEDPDGGAQIKTISYWQIKNPINTYNLTFYIGDYIHWHDTVMGEKGVLDLDFYALRYHEEQARKQFAVVKQMIHCFEYWMGPYPFYEDGYKLVEAPYLGMEHQSAVAYGNHYLMGYLGRDRSNSGVGMKWDYIIIHESGHEWFGNNITAQDMADNWIHEGITSYTETLFSQEVAGRDDAFRYLRGQHANIDNDKPIIGPYGVNQEGSGDMYDKGASIIHMVRMIMNDDEKFRLLLRGLNRDFYHAIVTTKQVEDYMSKAAGYDLKPFFDIYLRTVETPTLNYVWGRNTLNVYLSSSREDLTLPIFITKDGKATLLTTRSISIKEKNLIKDWKEYLDNYLLKLQEIDIR